MADEKISVLTEMTEAPERGADELAIVDDSAGETKRIKPEYLDNPQVNLLKNTGFQAFSLAADVEDYGSDGVTNGGFDSDTTSWLIGNDASASSVAGGQSGNCLKLLENGTENPFVYQSAITVVPSRMYQMRLYVKAGDEATYQYAVYDETNAAYIVPFVTAEATGAWVQHTVNYVVPLACVDVRIYLMQICAAAAGTYVLFDTVENYEIVPCNKVASTDSFDGWLRSGASYVYRIPLEDGERGGEFYGGKQVAQGAVCLHLWPYDYANPRWLAMISGRTLTVSAMVRTSTASAVSVGIKGTSWTSSDTHSGSGDWEKLTVTATIPESGMTDSYISIPTISGVGVEAEWTEGMLVFGSACPEYVPPQDKYIPLSAKINSSNYYAAGFSDESATQLIPQLDTDGKIGIGVEKIVFYAETRDAGSSGGSAEARVFGNGLHAYSGFVADCSGVANDVFTKNTGETQLVYDELDVTIEATAATLFDFYLVYQAIKVR